MTRFVLAAALLSMFTAGASAQSGTPEDQRACSGNVQRYCGRAIQGGDMAILSCLQQNRQRLSRACQGVLIKYGQ